MGLTQQAMSDDSGLGYVPLSPEQAEYLRRELELLGISEVEYYVLVDLWSPSPPELLASSLLPREHGTEEECRRAIERCLELHLMQVSNDETLLRMFELVRKTTQIGPIYGFPRSGYLDRTEAGITICSRISRGLFERNERKGMASEYGPVYTTVVRQQTAHYIAQRPAVDVFVSSLDLVGETITAIGIEECGPWKRKWWEPVHDGFKVVVETSNPPNALFQYWRASNSAIALERVEKVGESSCRKIELNVTALMDQLNRIGMTPSEWCIVRHLGDMGFCDLSFAAHLAAQESTTGGFRVCTYDECADALHSCVRKGWIWNHDDSACGRINRHLSSFGPVKLLQKIPSPNMGQFTLSLEGSDLFQSVYAAAYGDTSTFDAWEVGEDVFPQGTRCAYEKIIERENLEYYGTTKYGVSSYDGYDDAEWTVLRQSDPVPIGPWCVYWWNQFESGWKVEIERANRYLPVAYG